MPRVLVSTVPFAKENGLPVELLNQAGIDFVVNPIGRKLSEDELAEMIVGFDVIIAGTEMISRKVMERADKLKLISRVGVGLDGVDLNAAKDRGIDVAYTPDAPAPAVADLTIGLSMSLLRNIHLANLGMHERKWHRFFGRTLQEVRIGIIGVGRIGSLVIKQLEAIGVKAVMVNDLNEKQTSYRQIKLDWCEKDYIYKTADLISLHVPLTLNTHNMICHDELRQMKSDALLVNTARGGVVNEADLARVLAGGHLGGAAIDVFQQEPYSGELSEVDRCLLTSHMGSMTVTCRTRMETEATHQAIQYLEGQPLTQPVPKEEYELQRKWGFGA